MGTPSSRASRASALRPAERWWPGSGGMLSACAGGVSGPERVGGVTPMERRKGRNRGPRSNGRIMAHFALSGGCSSNPYYQNTALYPIIDLLERVALRFEQEESPPQKL